MTVLKQKRYSKHNNSLAGFQGPNTIQLSPLFHAFLLYQRLLKLIYSCTIKPRSQHDESHRSP